MDKAAGQGNTYLGQWSAWSPGGPCCWSCSKRWNQPSYTASTGSMKLGLVEASYQHRQRQQQLQHLKVSSSGWAVLKGSRTWTWPREVCRACQGYLSATWQSQLGCHSETAELVAQFHFPFHMRTCGPRVWTGGLLGRKQGSRACAWTTQTGFHGSTATSLTMWRVPCWVQIPVLPVRQVTGAYRRSGTWLSVTSRRQAIIF